MSKEEKCERCGSEIAPSAKAFVWHDRVVCSACYRVESEPPQVVSAVAPKWHKLAFYRSPKWFGVLVNICLVMGLVSWVLSVIVSMEALVEFCSQWKYYKDLGEYRWGVAWVEVGMTFRLISLSTLFLSGLIWMIVAHVLMLLRDIAGRSAGQTLRE